MASQQVSHIPTLTLSLLAAPLTVTAQARSKVPRIGILTPAAAASTPLWEAFRHGLRDLGYVEGKNIHQPQPAGSRRPADQAARMTRQQDGLGIPVHPIS